MSGEEDVAVDVEESEIFTEDIDESGPGDLTPEQIENIERLSRDLRSVARTMPVEEVRFIVADYYLWQKNRIRAGNQMKALDRQGKPRAIVTWLHTNARVLEESLKAALDSFTRKDELSQWPRSQSGLGPVTTAGIRAFIDVEKAKTAGAVWRHAGLDPSLIWYDGPKAKKLIEEAMQEAGTDKVTMEVLEILAAKTKRRSESFEKGLEFLKCKKWDKENLIKVLKIRPWNTVLKTICWKIGESFVKNVNNPKCFYGRLYARRKAQEWERNYTGSLAEQAEKGKERVGRSTEAWAWYAGCYKAEDARQMRCLSEEISGLLEVQKEIQGRLQSASEEEAKKIQEELERNEKEIKEKTKALEELSKNAKGKPGEGTPMLPPGHIHSRAKRYAVKIFLAHYLEVSRTKLGLEVVKPFPIAILGHKDEIRPPGFKG